MRESGRQSQRQVNGRLRSAACCRASSIIAVGFGGAVASGPHWQRLFQVKKGDERRDAEGEDHRAVPCAPR